MKNLIILVNVLFSISSFGQEPTAEHFVILNNVNSNLYDYKIIFNIDNEPTLGILGDIYFETEPLDSIKKDFSRNWEEDESDWNYSNSKILKSENGKEILIGYRINNIYVDDDAILTIARKNRKNQKIELMYAYMPIKCTQTHIIIKKFNKGKLKNINTYYNQSEKWFCKAVVTIK